MTTEKRNELQEMVNEMEDVINLVQEATEKMMDVLEKMDEAGMNSSYWKEYVYSKLAVLVETGEYRSFDPSLFDMLNAISTDEEA